MNKKQIKKIRFLPIDKPNYAYLYDEASRTLHLYPKEDEHTEYHEYNDCPCFPLIDKRNRVITHNEGAFDDNTQNISS